jgi:hypothetical protein
VTTKGNRNSLGGLDVKRILARFPERFLSVLVPIQPRIKGILGLISLGVKQPGHEVNCSPPSTATVKHLHSQCMPSRRGASLSTLLTLQLPFCIDRLLYEKYSTVVQYMISADDVRASYCAARQEHTIVGLNIL